LIKTYQDIFKSKEKKKEYSPEKTYHEKLAKSVTVKKTV